MTAWTWRRFWGLAIILTGVALFFVFPPGFHPWGNYVVFVSMGLSFIGWELLGSRATSAGQPTAIVINFRLLVLGVVLLIAAVALLYYADRERHKTVLDWLPLVLAFVAAALILIATSGTRGRVRNEIEKAEASDRVNSKPN